MLVKSVLTLRTLSNPAAWPRASSSASWVCGTVTSKLVFVDLNGSLFQQRGQNRSFRLVLPHDPIRQQNNVLGRVACNMIGAGNYFFALHLDTGASHLLKTTKVSVGVLSMVTFSRHKCLVPD